ncbi:DUF4394 domain-containing protein [Chitinophaga sp. YIM B06452]|uniref:DUF4394 domain-containing protein n=1 Tax=Chitinophaga sp. YIM B06452 TaxID=3082158 RepID=UPI0031FEC5EF
MRSIPLQAALTLALALSISCSKKKDDNTPKAPNAYALGTNNNLLAFHTSNPATVTGREITGLQGGEQLLGIDFRLSDGMLYGVGSTSRLYQINTSTGAATMVGPGPFPELLANSYYGIDFNPVADRLRVVNIADLNLRLNPANGSLAGKDVNITPGATAISAIAYANNYSGAASTVLYGIEASTGRLFRLDNPNGGILTLVGKLGETADAADGFDIVGQDNKAYALFRSVGTKLYRIDLQTGAATVAGDFPMTVKGLALVPGQ